MKAKNLLLLALGGAVAYYGYKMYQKNKAKSNVATMPSQETMQKTCEEQWNEKVKSMEFLSTDAEKKSKSAFINTCLAQVQHPLGVAHTMQKTCEEQWTEKAKTLRVTGDALATAKANFMLSCSPVLTATI